MEDEDLDLLEGDGDTDGNSDDGSTDDAPPADPKPKADAKESKRISDLMSKWQKEQARANAAEDRLKALEGGKAEPEIPADVKAWMDVAKDAARERVYNSDPRFAEYGIEQALLEGDTPDAMKASAKRVKDLIDSIETKARAEVLAEHGIYPDFTGSTPVAKTDFASMSDAEFDKVVAQHGGGGGY